MEAFEAIRCIRERRQSAVHLDEGGLPAVRESLYSIRTSSGIRNTRSFATRANAAVVSPATPNYQAGPPEFRDLAPIAEIDPEKTAGTN